jgi:hypothetical protein
MDPAYARHSNWTLVSVEKKKLKIHGLYLPVGQNQLNYDSIALIGFFTEHKTSKSTAYCYNTLVAITCHFSGTNFLASISSDSCTFLTK